MGTVKINNSTYLDNDWQSEITSKNALKKGFADLNFEFDTVWKLKTNSVFDIDGNFYIVETDEELTMLSESAYITYDGSSYDTYNGDLIFNGNKNGYYVTGTNERIIGYYDGNTIEPVKTKAGIQDDLTITNSLFVSGYSTLKIVPTYKEIPFVNIPYADNVVGCTSGDPTVLIKMVIFKDPSSGNTYIYSTKDNGRNWYQDGFATGLTPNQISHNTNANKGLATWGTTTFGYTVDLGVNWAGTTTADIANGCYVGNLTGHVVCDSGIIYKVQDSVGVLNTSPTTENLQSVVDNMETDYNSLIAVAVGDNGTIVYCNSITGDYIANTWVSGSTTDSTTDNFLSVTFDRKYNIFLAATATDIYSSTDGSSFSKIVSGLTSINNLIGLNVGTIVSDSEYVYLLDGSALYKITTGGYTGGNIINDNQFALIKNDTVQNFSY